MGSLSRMNLWKDGMATNDKDDCEYPYFHFMIWEGGNRIIIGGPLEIIQGVRTRRFQGR